MPFFAMVMTMIMLRITVPFMLIFMMCIGVTVVIVPRLMMLYIMTMITMVMLHMGNM